MQSKLYLVDFAGDLYYSADPIYALATTGLWISYNNANTWNNTNCPGSNHITLTVKNNTVVVSPGLYFTHNYGTNRDSIAAPVVPFQSAPLILCMNNYYLLAGFSNSVFRLPLSVITNTHDVTEIADIKS